ncbi:MAG: YqzL family protein [Defluviitaleaceae bacterium]|nr:YqzL family protein [Defluviitaleaceae bacterium]
MYEEFWNLFSHTGNINAYLAYKNMARQEQVKGDDGKDGPRSQWR